MKKTLVHHCAAAAIALLTFVTTARGSVPVPITNAGFEDPAKTEGAWQTAVPGWSQGQYNVTAPTVWIVGVPSNDVGLYNPSTGEYTSGAAPEGLNMGFTTSEPGFDVGLNQVLSTNLQPDAQYNLSVKVGNPSLYNGGATANWRIELLAGGALLQSATGSSPANDATFTTASLTYTSGAAPTQLGQPLEIRLLAANFTSGYEVDYDDVQLTVTLANPVAKPGGPYTVVLLPGGSLSLNGSASLPSDGQILTAYDWDLNNDDTFGDVTGATPAALSYATLMGTYGMVLGSNTVKLRVTDSAPKTSTTSTTVTLRVASSNANLANLVPSTGTLTPAFDPGTLSYTASVPYAITSITVTPTKADAGTTITVNGNPVTSGSASAPIGLTQGPNTITTVVTAEDASTTQTYTLTVTRGTPSTNANLANLVPSTGTLTPAFDSGTLSYTASVSNAITSMTVTPTAADATATITVNGNTVASVPISLSVGDNTITTVVTAQDTTTKTYTLTVTRAAPSSNANLANLMPSAGTLTPTFDPGILNYTASVPNSTTSMTVTPTTADAGATITVNTIPVTSGSASAPISLSVGTNTITTVVTAQDTTTIQTYTLTVTRAPDTTPPAIVSLSPADNATTAPISANLVVTFDEAIAIGTGNITIKNLTDGTQATISITDATQVSAAGAVLTINPTADLTTGKNYAIQIDPGVVTDLSANPFAGIADDTTWNFTAASVTTYTGTSGSGGTDKWNVSGNWNNGVPSGGSSAVIPDKTSAFSVAATSSTTPTYSGNLTIGNNVTLQVGYVNGSQFAACTNVLGTPGSTTISMGANSIINYRNPRGLANWTVPAINLYGNATVRNKESTETATNPSFNYPITGSYSLTLDGAGTSTLNASNSFAALSAINAGTVQANAAGSLGNGNVTLNDTSKLQILAANPMADTATLTLSAATAGKLTMSANDTVNALFIGTVQLPAGNYTSASGAWITGTGTLTVSTGASDTTPPTVVSMVDNVGGGPIYQDQAQVTYTVTFSEEIATTLTTADFEVVAAGGASGTIASVTKTSTFPAPAVYSVVVAPSGTGTIQLRIKATSVIADLYGNALVVPVADDTTITINSGTNPGTGNRWWDGPTTTGITNGASGGGAGTWSTTNTNWDRGTGFAGPVAWNNSNNDSAIFSGSANAAYNATVSGSINLKDLTFDTTGTAGARYTIDGGTLNFAPGGVIRATNNQYNQTITSTITGSPAVETKDFGAGNTYEGLKFEPASGNTQTLGAILNPNNTGTTDKAGIYLGGSTTGNSVVSINYAGGDQYGTVYKTGTSTWTVGNITTGTVNINGSGGTLIINGTVTGMYNGFGYTAGTLSGNASLRRNDRRGNHDFLSGFVVAPGNGVGTITILDGTTQTPTAAQQYTIFRAGAIYEWEVGPASQDTVHIAAGKLQLDGFTLKIRDAGGTPAVGAQLPVFTYNPATVTTRTLALGSVVFDTSALGPEWTIGTLALTDNGTGTIYLTGLAKTAGYTAWETTNGATGQTLAQDHDNDGVPNGIEYFLGGPSGHTTGFTALPGVVNTDGTLSVTWTKAADYTGVYPTDFVVETSETLTGTWTAETLGGTVTITGNAVKYTFPSPLGSQKFARLKVTGP